MYPVPNLLTRRLALLDDDDHRALLGQGLRGIERETLRIDRAGKLAQTPHPRALGSALTNPQITTDYAEALLEFITPAEHDISITLNKLDASDSVQSALDLQNSKSISDVGAADPAKAYSTLIQLNNALQQSVSVSKSILDLAAFKQF